MKNEVINRLTAVLGALEHVSVHGKANLANLSGSIAILEEVKNMLIDCEITQMKEKMDHE